MMMVRKVLFWLETAAYAVTILLALAVAILVGIVMSWWEEYQ